jgi:hypothetical protein
MYGEWGVQFNLLVAWEKLLQSPISKSQLVLVRESS